MNGYSITQGTNFAGFGAALTIIVKILAGGDLASVTEAEWQIIIAAAVVAVSTVISYFDRLSKGDVNLAGVKKY